MDVGIQMSGIRITTVYNASLFFQSWLEQTRSIIQVIASKIKKRMPIFKYLLEPICKSHHDIESGQGKHQVEHGPGVNDLQTKK